MRKPKKKLFSDIERNVREIERIRKEYAESDEAKGLEARSTNELIEMHSADSDWLRTPCGDINIDGGIIARSMLVSNILQARRVPFAHGRFQGPVLP